MFYLSSFFKGLLHIVKVRRMQTKTEMGEAQMRHVQVPQVSHIPRSWRAFRHLLHRLHPEQEKGSGQGVEPVALSVGVVAMNERK